MYILAIETTGPLGSVAIIDGDGRISMKASTEEMNHLKDLMPMADSLIAQLHISKQELTAVAASIGPGSFTGIRIGVSSARAIAQALDIPCIAVPTLDSFRLKLSSAGHTDAGGSATKSSAGHTDAGGSATKSSESGKSLVVPVFNARRGQVYGAVFGPENKMSAGQESRMSAGQENRMSVGPESRMPVGRPLESSGKCLIPGPYMLTDVLKHISEYVGSPEYSGENIVFYGDGIDAYEQQINDAFNGTGIAFEFAPKEERYQTAAMTAEYALAEYRSGNTLEVNELLPDYMRVAEAEQKLRDGSLARERAAKMARFRSR